MTSHSYDWLLVPIQGYQRRPVRPFIDGSEQIARSAWHAMCNALAAVRRALVRGFNRMDDRMERLSYEPRDAFFGQAVDLCDLEHRIEHYERTGLTHY